MPRWGGGAVAHVPWKLYHRGGGRTGRFQLSRIATAAKKQIYLLLCSKVAVKNYKMRKKIGRQWQKVTKM